MELDDIMLLSNPNHSMIMYQSQFWPDMQEKRSKPEETWEKKVARMMTSYREILMEIKERNKTYNCIMKSTEY